MLFPLNAGARDVDYNKVLENLNEKLSESTTTADSILILSNIFDIKQSQESYGMVYARQIYEMARRINDDELALEMLRQRANGFLRNIDSLDYLMAEAKAFPESPSRKETETFIQFKRTTYLDRYADQEAVDTLFSRQLQRVTLNPPTDLYEKIQLLHAVCTYIARQSHGDVLIDYIQQLGSLINKLPRSAYSIRNSYLIQAAESYGAAGATADAIHADEALLQVCDSLENSYAANGRPYRNYDANRFQVYVRLLSNWEHLPADKVEDYYNRAMEMVRDNRRAAITMRSRRLADTYHMMANKKYAELIPLLREQVDNPKLQKHRYKLLKYLVTAADSLGDRNTALWALRRYSAAQDSLINSRIEERYRELQVVYDTNKYKDDYNSLESDMLENQSSLQRTILVICVGALIAMLVLLVMLIKMNRKLHKLSNNLSRSNKSLQEESESLRRSQAELTEARDRAQNANQFKTDFIKNMSREVSVPLNGIIEYSRLIVDCTDSDDKPYLQRYADQVQMNGEFLQAIIDDVLNLAEIDSDTVSLRREYVSLRDVAETAVDSVKSLLAPGVTVEFDTVEEVDSSRNLETYTDARRVQQILVNLLSNAAKYTKKGRIFLECHAVDNGEKVAICVTDTGIGIDPELKDKIFERFFKVDKDAQGIGLGLPISRMLAHLLGGDLVLDTTYHRGARFIFTLPLVNN